MPELVALSLVVAALLVVRHYTIRQAIAGHRPGPSPRPARDARRRDPARRADPDRLEWLFGCLRSPLASDGVTLAQADVLGDD
jgi:hypothetical protein